MNLFRAHNAHKPGIGAFSSKCFSPHLEARLLSVLQGLEESVRTFKDLDPQAIDTPLTKHADAVR